MKQQTHFWKLFPSFVLISFISLLAVTIIACVSFKSFHYKQRELDLEARARLLATEVTRLLKAKNFSEVQSFSQKAGNNSNTRITIVLPSGDVIGDSSKNPSDMDNHRDRPEISNALRSNKGVSIRYGSTLNIDSMYLAIPVISANDVIALIRTSIPLLAINEELWKIYFRVTSSFFALLILASFCSWRLAKALSQPLEKIRAQAQEIAKGNFSRKIEFDPSEPLETSSLGQAINSIAHNLNHRIETIIEQNTDKEILKTQSTRLEDLVKSRTADLEESLLKLQSYFDLPTIGMVVAKPDKTFIELNDRICEMTGYSKDELRHMKWNEITHPDDLDNNIDLINKVVSGEIERFIIDKRYIRKNGSIFDAEVSVGCVKKGDGNPDYFVAMIQDISNRKQNEKDLSEYRNHLETLVENKTHELQKLSLAINQTFGGVVITDKEGVIEFANPAFCEYSGYSMDEIVSKTHNIFNSGNHSEEFFKNLWDTIMAGEQWAGEVCDRKKDGTLFWVRQHITPVKNSAGEITNFIGLCLDITQRKEDEEKLKANAIELERSNFDLQQFTSIASHDLKEPLRKIIDFGSRLKDTTNHLDDLSLNYINRMQKSSIRMQTLINDLLAFSKIESNYKKFKQVDLNLIVKESLSNLELRIAQEKGTIKVDELPHLEGDATQLIQLFQNLIGNAVKYHKSKIPPLINIRHQPSGNGKAFIVVEDNGIGFKQKYEERIFEPFQRLHGRHEFEGTGIGLAICKKIIERHKGSISVKSTPDEGTAFTITLPFKQ